MQEYVNFRITTILSESLEKDFGKITDDQFICKDLEGDSFGIADIKIKIHKTFNIPMNFLDSKCNSRMDITVGELKQIVYSFLFHNK